MRKLRYGSLIGITALLSISVAVPGEEISQSEQETKVESSAAEETPAKEQETKELPEASSEVFPEESSAVEETPETITTQDAQEQDQKGWRFGVSADFGEQRSCLILESGYYSDGVQWLGLYGEIPKRSDTGEIEIKEIYESPLCLLDENAGKYYVNAAAVADAYDRLADCTLMQELVSIWTQGTTWVELPAPEKQKGEELWGSFQMALKMWFPVEDCAEETFTDVKSLLPKWWADWVVYCAADLLDAYGSDELYELYELVVENPYDASDWEKRVDESSSAGALLRSCWSDVTDEVYENAKDVVFGNDENGLSSGLTFNYGNVGEDTSIVYARTLRGQVLGQITFFWTEGMSNAVDSPSPEHWSITTDELISNYKVLMGIEEVDETEQTESSEAEETSAEEKASEVQEQQVEKTSEIEVASEAERTSGAEAQEQQIETTSVAEKQTEGGGTNATN